MAFLHPTLFKLLTIYGADTSAISDPTIMIKNVIIDAYAGHFNWNPSGTYLCGSLNTRHRGYFSKLLYLRYLAIEHNKIIQK